MKEVKSRRKRDINQGDNNQQLPKENPNVQQQAEKKDDTFIYAAILFGSIIVGAIVLLLKLLGLF